MSESEMTEPISEDNRQWLDLPAPAPVPPIAAPNARSSQGLPAGSHGRLVINPITPAVAVEQYRRLAAVMHQAQLDRGIKTVMIASALTAEGKTLTATNLALTLSESYRRRVLLVDADLRRPMLHSIFEIPNLAGLSDGLKSETLRKMPLVDVTTNLTILPGGRPDPDPMSGLTSPRMKHVMQQASERFDWVILDTPPVMLLPDGHLIAAMVDTVVLVIGAGRTPFDALKRAVDAIGHPRIIGVVLNYVGTTGLDTYIQSSDFARPLYPLESGLMERR